MAAQLLAGVGLAGEEASAEAGADVGLGREGAAPVGADVGGAGHACLAGAGAPCQVWVCLEIGTGEREGGVPAGAGDRLEDGAGCVGVIAVSGVTQALAETPAGLSF